MANQASGSNKKKKKGAAKNDSRKMTTTEASTKEAPKQPGALSNPQLTALILFSMGIAKLLQLRSAASAASSKVCIEHLGEEACQDETVLSLLQYKFSSAIYGCVIATLIGLQTWNSDEFLMQVNSLLVLSPWWTSVFVFHTSTAIPDKVTFQQMLKFLVLAALAFSTALPFRGPRIRTNKQLPSIVCATLMLLSVLQAVQYWRLSIGSDIQSTWLAVNPDHLTVTEFNASIVQLTAVDCISMAFLMFFCWRALPDATQRTILMYTGVIKAVESYQFQSMAEESPLWNDSVAGVGYTMAFICGVASFLPGIAFKKKLG